MNTRERIASWVDGLIRHHRHAWLLGIALLASYPLGCSPKLRGSAGPNSIPELFIVNVPPDRSEFETSPTVYWYGSDRDGQIARYDYAIVTEADVDSVAATLPGEQPAVEKYIAFVLNDQYSNWTSIFPDSLTGGELATQQAIRLYASRFPAECDSAYHVRFDASGQIIDTIAVPVDCVSDTIPQYFFLRAVDDHGASSKIKYRSYKRRNHWPETQSNASLDQATFVSLPRLTGTYEGILLNWGGSDRLDYLPPAEPLLEFHWRLYGPFPIDPNDPSLRPTLDDTLGLQPIFESANRDPRFGVWVRDTLTMVYDLWRQADSRPDPLNDTTVTRTAWFMFVVTARDDAYIEDETPSVRTFKAVSPKFERKICFVDDTWYNQDTYTNPAPRPLVADPNLNQHFYWNLVQMVYPEADTMQDFWWRSKAPSPGEPCNPASGRVRCGNYVSLEMLLRHRLCVIANDDVFDPTSAPGIPPATQDVLRRYLDAGGMVFFFGRHSFLLATNITQASPPAIYDFCGSGFGSSNLACNYFDMDGMYYPGWRRFAIPITYPGSQGPASNDEFVSAQLVAQGTGLPPTLEIDRARVDSMFMLPFIKDYLCRNGTCQIIGVPDVNYIILGSNSTPLYLFNSWRPGGPIPPENGPSFSNDKPVAVRRVGPSRSNPLYKTAYFTFPLYFIKQEQSEAMFRQMVDWFFLPFSQS
jgi:hypothetical protein